MTSAAAAGEAASKPAISTRAWLGCLLASILLVYYRTIHYPFFFDDWAGIVFNPRIQDWNEIPGYFTKHLWYHTTGDFRAEYYRPFYLGWFFLNYQFFGINHFSEEKARQQAMKFQDVATMLQTCRLAISRHNAS